MADNIITDPRWPKYDQRLPSSESEFQVFQVLFNLTSGGFSLTWNGFQQIPTSYQSENFRSFMFQYCLFPTYISMTLLSIWNQVRHKSESIPGTIVRSNMFHIKQTNVHFTFSFSIENNKP